MTLFIECVVGIIIFSLIVVPLTMRDPVGSLGDYPEAIRERCIELGIIESRKIRLSKREIIKKILAVIVLMILLAYVQLFKSVELPHPNKVYQKIIEALR